MILSCVFAIKIMNLNVSDRYFTWPELSCFGEDPILSASNQIECLVCVGLHLSVGSEHIVTCLVTFSISKNKHCLLKISHFNAVVHRPVEWNGRLIHFNP